MQLNLPSMLATVNNLVKATTGTPTPSGTIVLPPLPRRNAFEKDICIITINALKEISIEQILANKEIRLEEERTRQAEAERDKAEAERDKARYEAFIFACNNQNMRIR